MIKQVVRLVRPGLFLPCFEVETPKDTDVIVRPRYLSICAADQRYFQGNRPPEVLKKKLPIALFHECIGEVLHDPIGELPAGTFCVLLPGGTASTDDDSNYVKGAFFRSSNADGFCQEVMSLDRHELIPVYGDHVWLFVFSELMSVCCQAVRKLENTIPLPSAPHIGIWGDGSMGFTMALTVSRLKPDWTITVFGRHDEKLMNFSFVKQRVNIADSTFNQPLDIAFECVGGVGAQSAIGHAMQLLRPKGHIMLMGVSEISPTIPTRMILEKGLTLIGSSRSTKKDFLQAISIIEKDDVKNTLLKLVSAKVSVHAANEFINAFYEDKNHKYKTVIKIDI